MNEWYFYQEGGVTMGPITNNDIRDRIREGRIRLFDMILREGDPAWKMALEFPDLKEEFKETTKKTFQNRPWVVLTLKGEDDFEFATLGPFSKEELREQLLAGKVSYSDYAWKEGFGEWKRIGSLPEFNHRLRKRSSEPPPVPDKPEQLLQNVVELRRVQRTHQMPQEEPPPPEADGEDLTKSPVNLREEPKPTVVPRREETRRDPNLPDRRKSRRSRRRKTVPWFDWGIVAVLVLVLGAVSLVLSRAIRPRKVGEIPTVIETAPPGFHIQEDTPPPPVEVLPPKPTIPVVEDVKPSEPEIETPPPPKKTAKPPTLLVLKVQATSPTDAKIEIRANGSEDFPVYLQIIGLPGQVSSGISFYRYIKIKPNQDPTRPLDLSSVRLPQGRFILRAYSGTLHREERFDLGLNDPQYKQAILRMRRTHAAAVWSERLAVYRICEILEKRVRDGMAGAKFSMRSLEALGEVRRTNGHKYVLFEDWFELKSILDDARLRPSPTILARIKKIREKMTTFSVWK